MADGPEWGLFTTPLFASPLPRLPSPPFPSPPIPPPLITRPHPRPVAIHYATRLLRAPSSRAISICT